MIVIETNEMEFCKVDGNWQCVNKRLQKKIDITNKKLIQCLDDIECRNEVESCDVNWEDEKDVVIRYIMLVMLNELEISGQAKGYKYFICYVNNVVTNARTFQIPGDVLITRKGLIKDEDDINDLREWVKQKPLEDLRKKRPDLKIESSAIVFTSITRLGGGENG